MDGVLVVDKPAGPTSHDIVSAVRKALRQKKVGHTGTLDPLATGVLPLVLGKATKIARYLTGGDKAYDAVIRLGVRTSTLDTQGEVIEEKPVDVTEQQIEAALDQFRGDIDQVPPMYSAKKVDGNKLYELARKGIEVEREPKQVTVHHLVMTKVALPDVYVEVACSAGTYVRVLAEDLGKTLGCGAHLASLRRTRAGPFTLEDAVELDAVVDDPGLANDRIVPVGRALSVLPRIDVPRDIARMIATGYQLTVADLRTVDTPTFVPEDALTLATDGGEPIAVVRALIGSEELSRLRRDQRALKTERVLQS